MEGEGWGTQWGGRFDRWRYRLQNTPYFCVFKYARAVKQKVWNKAENRERHWGDTLKYDWHARRVRLSRIARVRFLSHVLPISLLILRKTPTVLQSSDGKFFPPISRPPALNNCVRNLEFWKDFYKFTVSAFIHQKWLWNRRITTSTLVNNC